MRTCCACTDGRCSDPKPNMKEAEGAGFSTRRSTPLKRSCATNWYATARTRILRIVRCTPAEIPPPVGNALNGYTPEVWRAVLRKPQQMTSLDAHLEATIVHLEKALYTARQAHAALGSPDAAMAVSVLTPPLVPVEDTASVLSSTGSSTYKAAWTDHLSRVSSASMVTPA